MLAKSDRFHQNTDGMAAHAHAVQFYESPDFLFGKVAGFLASGLRNGHGAVLVATAEHRDGVIRALSTLEIDADAAAADGSLCMVGAREMLDRFMVGSMPDRDRFLATIGGVIDTAARGGARSVHAFGEMVDVLYRDGNPGAALRLEELWNELGSTREFSLLCAYPLGNFYKETHGGVFDGICERHSVVYPTETFDSNTPEETRREIARLQQRAAALSSEVEHRRELEKSLREALQARMEAERAKDEFLATLSHELRTPLTAILGWARLLKHGAVDAAMMQTAMDTIDKSATTQAALIDDLLDISRIKTGHLSLVPKPVDLRDVLSSVVETVRLAAESRGIRIAVRVDEGASTIVNGDSTRLQQIFWNLASNAVKFSRGGDEVRIRLSADRSTVTVVVSDDGRGIAPDFIAQVFEPFRQAESTISRAHGGLGLGLAIVKHLTEAHGGTVDAMSEGEGKGATFTVTFPAVNIQ